MNPEVAKNIEASADSNSRNVQPTANAGRPQEAQPASNDMLSSSINRPSLSPLRLLLHEIDEHGNTDGSGARVGECVGARALEIGLKVQIQNAPSFSPARTSGDDRARQIEAIAEYSHKTIQRLGDAFIEQRESGVPIVSVGGNHNRAIELSAYFRECALRGKEPVIIWIDAHPDAHTPETTESGNVHGMVASLTLRGGPEQLLQLLGDVPTLKPENLIYLGLNAVDEKEVQNLKSAGIPEENVISMMDVVLRNGMSRWTERVNAINERLGDRALWWCEVDVDVLHQKEVVHESGKKGADMDNNFGLFERELRASLIHLTQTAPLGGLGISEISKNAGMEMIELVSDLALIMGGIVNRPYAVHLDHNQIDRPDEMAEAVKLSSPTSESKSYLDYAAHVLQRYGREILAGAALTAASVLAFFHRDTTSDFVKNPEDAQTVSTLSKGDDRQYAFTGVHSSNRFVPLPYTGGSIHSVKTLIELAGEYVSTTDNLQSWRRERVLSCLYAAELNGGNTEHMKALKDFLIENRGNDGRRDFFNISAEYDAFKQQIDRHEIVEYLTGWNA